jgi:hypothetical protein
MRQNAALHKVEGLEASVENGTWLPDDDYIADIRDRWRTEGYARCRFWGGCHSKELHDPRYCSGYRCDPAYWRKHNIEVGHIMELIAPYVGGNAVEYRRLGELHDLDYLKAPHDDGPISPTKDIHPCPVVNDLEQHGAPKEIMIAILEHSPHGRIDGKPHSVLSQSLFFADNFATCRSAGCPLGSDLKFPRPGRMPNDLWDNLMHLTFAPLKDNATATPWRWQKAVEAIESVFPEPPPISTSL